MMHFCFICKAESTLEECFKKHSRGKMNRICWCRACKVYFKRNKNEDGHFCSDKCKQEYVVPICQEQISVFMYHCLVCKKEFKINGDLNNWGCGEARHKLICGNTLYVKTCGSKRFYDRYNPNGPARCSSVICPGYTKRMFYILLMCIKRLGVNFGPIDVKRYLFSYCYELNTYFLRDKW